MEPIREDRPDGRVYITPDGDVYPSVTTVLGAWGDGKEELEAWRKAVGEEEAQAVSRRAADRGTRIHQLCEDELNNSPTQPGIFDLECFRVMRKSFHRINNIRCIEQKLYSDILKVAGTVDMIAEFDGLIAIIDWKTSAREKFRNDIHGYFCQCASYAVAYEERTGIRVTDIVIVMAVDGDKEPLIFIEKVRDWVPEFIKRRRHFRKLKGF